MPHRKNRLNQTLSVRYVIVTCCLLVVLQAKAVESAFKPPGGATQELPAGVPRVVDTNGNVIFVDCTFTTPAYQDEAFRLVIAEANKVARELQLHETLPITAPNLTHAFISPFGYAINRRAVGNITTSNYWYGVAQDYKFSQLSIADYDAHYFEFRDRYRWPRSQIDTNAAYALASKWLADVHMDVGRLNHDCEVHANVSSDLDPASVSRGRHQDSTFTPIYFISWTTKARGTPGSVAYVELFLPTKTLLQLCVNEPKYILRPALPFTNLATLFPGKATIRTNWPTKPEAIQVR